MNFRRIAFIAVIVIAVHLVILVVITHVPALPKAHYIPPPNFGVRTETYEDPKTGEKTIYQEFRVSTKLAPQPSPASIHTTPEK